MRVSRRIRRDDRGAVLVMFAAFAVVALVFLAIVVDLGDQRQDRRDLTTATDASALDVAQEWANAGLIADFYGAPVGDVSDCSAQAQNYLRLNRTVDPASYSCEATRIDSRSASVSVFANDVVDYQFGDAVGQDSGQVNSRTTVAVQSTKGGSLRPFAVCASDSLELNTWLNNPTSPIDLIIGGPKFLSVGCGQNNGNWGMVQFDSQSNGVGNVNGDGLAGALARGTEDETITIDGSVSGDPEVECEKSYAEQIDENGISCLGQVTGNPWTNNGVGDALTQLKTDGTIVNFPVYGNVVDLGGSATGYPVNLFVEARVRSFCGDANPTALAQAELDDGACSGGKDNFMHLELLRTSSGKCCNISADNQVLTICDVGSIGGDIDADDLEDNCQVSDGFGTTPTTFAPPLTTPPPCTFSSIAASHSAVSRPPPANNTAIGTAVDFTITVSAENCPGAFIVQLRNAGNSNRVNTLATVRTNPTTVVAQESATDTNYRPNGGASTVWNLEVLYNGVALPYAPTVTLTVL